MPDDKLISPLVAVTEEFNLQAHLDQTQQPDSPASTVGFITGQMAEMLLSQVTSVQTSISALSDRVNDSHTTILQTLTASEKEFRAFCDTQRASCQKNTMKTVGTEIAHATEVISCKVKDAHEKVEEVDEAYREADSTNFKHLTLIIGGLVTIVSSLMFLVWEETKTKVDEKVFNEFKVSNEKRINRVETTVNDNNQILKKIEEHLRR